MSASTFKNSVVRVYCLLVIAVITIIVVNIVCQNIREINYGLDCIYSIDKDWTDSTGERFEFDNLYEYEKDDDGYVTAYYTTSGNLEDGDSICFKSIDCYVRVSINGENVYETQVADSVWLNNSPGIRWNFVRITDVDKSQQVELGIKPAYTGECQIDDIKMGDRATLVLKAFSEKLIDILVSFVVLLLGLLCIAISIILISRKNKGIYSDFGMGYFGVFIIAGAIWSLAETDVLQLFVRDVHLVNQVAQMVYILGTIPMMLYLDSTYDIFKNKIARILLIFNVLYIVACIVAQVIGVSDFHTSMYGSFVFYGIMEISMLYCVLGSWRRIFASGGNLNIHVLLRNIGLVLMVICMCIDTGRFWAGDVDRALFSRYGLLIIALLIGIGNGYQSLALVQKGMKAEIISHLAYTDGLTEVGNRTAFNERIDAIVNDNDGGCGFIVFDVNNLKKINDTLGHAAGDEVICISANIISETFGQHGQVYRTGGDEFVVIIDDNEAQQMYKNEVESFYSKMEECNNRKDILFSVIIAHGFAHSEVSERGAIKEALFTADKLMYVNKAEMKQLYPLAFKSKMDIGNNKQIKK